MSILFLLIAASSSKNAVSFSSARTTKRFPSPRCLHQQSKSVAPRNRRLRRSLDSNEPCCVCGQPVPRLAAPPLVGCTAWLADLATDHKPDPFLKYLCNLRPTFEAIKTRRRSSRPIFQPKRQKTDATSVKQAMLSAPCTICPASPRKNASPNPMIAPRMMLVPFKEKSIARTGYSKHENRAGRRHAFRLLFRFYGNDETKFPKISGHG